jgi:predicted nucleotidyltransferase
MKDGIKTVGLNLDKKKIADFCKRNHIRKLSLFGSVLRNALESYRPFGPDSDIDVLVEFDPEHIPGFLRLSAMQDELSALLGNRKIDLVTKDFLNHRIQNQILAEAKIQYAE